MLLDCGFALGFESQLRQLGNAEPAILARMAIPRRRRRSTDANRFDPPFLPTGGRPLDSHRLDTGILQTNNGRIISPDQRPLLHWVLLNVDQAVPDLAVDCSVYVITVSPAQVDSVPFESHDLLDFGVESLLGLRSVVRRVDAFYSRQEFLVEVDLLVYLLNDAVDFLWSLDLGLLSLSRGTEVVGGCVRLSVLACSTDVDRNGLPLCKDV